MSTIVITGVSRGLGRVMVRAFTEQQHTVCGCARSADAIDELIHEFGAPHRFAAVDVAHDSQVGSWARDVIAQCGPPDFLINNGAIINENAPLWNVSAHEFDQLMAVNVNGTANTIRHFVPAMVERGSGVIINFSSGWGRSVSPKVAPYCASKWAIEGLTQALSEDLPHGLVAVPLNPGVINTEMLQSVFRDRANSYPTPDEWADVAIPFMLGLTDADSGQSLTVPVM